MVGMDVVCPFPCASIGSITDIRKEAEIEMIVCVDEPREQEKP
jgi:hypothetical protein